jgi:hypothetical protein
MNYSSIVSMVSMVFFSSNKYISVMSVSFNELSVQLLNACELKKDILFNFFYNWMQGKKNLSFLLTQTTPFFSACPEVFILPFLGKHCKSDPCSV